MENVADLMGRADSLPVTLDSFLGGRPWSGGGETQPVHDPATGRVIAVYASAGADGVRAARQAAEVAFPAWRATPARERAALLHALANRIEAEAERLARLDSLDTGNPLTAMRADVTKGVAQIREAAGLALQVTGEVYPLPGLHFTQREPWGVVGRMTTWNHPAMYTCVRLATALVAGNTVVMKPSELAPLSTVAIAELTAGLLPDGVVNVVVGGADTGAALVADPGIRRLTFTGSTRTALAIQEAAARSGTLKTVTFELGGKNPIVVFPDVDLEETAAAVARGMNYTRVQGQSCGATSWLLVHESIADALLEKVAEIVRVIRIGMPTDPATEMGPLITTAARDRCLAMVRQAVSDGARVVAGGGVPGDPALANGAFLEPTIVDQVAPGTQLATEEVYGPVLAVTTWRTEAEATSLANAGPYGLTAAIWTQDIDRALRLAGQLETGYIWINDVETRFPAIPFGGWGDSGIGLEHGLEEVLSMTRVKAVNVRVR